LRFPHNILKRYTGHNQATLDKQLETPGLQQSWQPCLAYGLTSAKLLTFGETRDPDQEQEMMQENLHCGESHCSKPVVGGNL